MQHITRKGTFDSGHRVMNEKMKCFNVHGHTYLYELTFSFQSQEHIGYAIDFKEIKRVACQWIDDFFDHGMILNQKDKELIETTVKLGSKCWLMSLNGKNCYCNPTVENIAKELFLGVEYLMSVDRYQDTGLLLSSITLHETPNCYTTCYASSISSVERDNFYEERLQSLKAYRSKLGIVEYDDTIKK